MVLGLVLQLALSVTAPPEEGSFVSAADRVVHFFRVFTVLSNVAVVIATGLLAIDLDRRSTLLRVLRLDGLIVIAGHRRRLPSRPRPAPGADRLERGRRRAAAHRLTDHGGAGLVAPVLWIVDTLVRGALVQDRAGCDSRFPVGRRQAIRDGAYRSFTDVQEHGYPLVIANVSIVAVLHLLLAFGALALDRRLSGCASPPASAGSQTRPERPRVGRMRRAGSC